ncbi:MAG: 2-amino-4-hydroxy-6-hydroxymethyldihydropteridine diphosphokinase [Proteobacteria bacterium]|nr:2-amino-4-hydroxy-6-hydroxymethyldihydropteridine diphosphokinase [Pseudomonadota bacterium]
MAENKCAGAAIHGLPGAFDAILALGTNIGDRTGNIEDAIRRLTADGAIRIVARSHLYRTAPWGVTDQDWFVNACVGIGTKLAPHELLARCQAVENDMGRVRTRHWGPRIIDVDILAIRDLQIRDPDLTVPHPLIAERAFVLVPLRDIAPDVTIGGKTLADMLAALDARDVVPFEA